MPLSKPFLVQWESPQVPPESSWINFQPVLIKISLGECFWGGGDVQPLGLTSETAKDEESHPHWPLDLQGKHEGNPPKECLREFPLWLNGNESNYYPWGYGFGPWPHLVGWGSSTAVSSSNLALLWLWGRPVATALAWEPPCAMGMALKSKKKKKKKKKKKLKSRSFGNYHCGSAIMNPTSIHEYAGSIPGLAQWVKDLALLWAVVEVGDVAPIPCCCGCGVGQQL